MKKILVPIDFSKPSEYAAKMAARIAKKTDAIIYLIHLIELPKGVIDMGAGSRFSIPESMLYLRKTREKVLEFKENIFEDDINVDLKISSIKDFDPGAIAEQIPELSSLLELRRALQALRGPLGNVPAFRKTIQAILENDDTRKQVMEELGLTE